MYVPLLKKFIHNLFIKKSVQPSFTLQVTLLGPAKALGAIAWLGVKYGGFMDVLEHLIEVATTEFDIKPIHNFDIDSHLKTCSRRLLDYE
jgi:hypothetical protein